MHRTPRHVRSSLIAGALVTLLTIPAIGTALVQRSRQDTRVKNEVLKLARTAKRLSNAKKESLTSTVASATAFKVPAGNAQGIFTNNAATDQESIFGYFAGQKLALVRIGLPFLKKPFLAKELRLISLIFPDTLVAKTADETAAKIESEKFDENDVNKNLDLLTTTIAAQYQKKGEAANFNFQAGSSIGVSTVLAILYSVEDFEMQKQVKSTFAKHMENAKVIAKLPTGDLQPELKTAFATYSEAKITDSDTAFAAIQPVDDAFKKALN